MQLKTLSFAVHVVEKNGLKLYTVKKRTDADTSAESGEHWVTLKNGEHVLLNGENEVISGAGGNLNGTKFSKARLGNKKNPFPVRKAEEFQKVVLAESAEEMDKYLRPTLVKVWAEATHEQRMSAYVYTRSEYEGINEDLRNLRNGTVVTTSLGAERINGLTDIIQKSSYDKDIKVSRVISLYGLCKMFNLDMAACDALIGKPEAFEKAFSGKKGVELGFASTTVSNTIAVQDSACRLNILCPAGTKMLYAEPFSAYGGEQRTWGTVWDGKSPADGFSVEDEVIIQRGTTFKCVGLKVDSLEIGDMKWEVDLQVVSQDDNLEKVKGLTLDEYNKIMGR